MAGNDLVTQHVVCSWNSCAKPWSNTYIGRHYGTLLATQPEMTVRNSENHKNIRRPSWEGTGQPNREGTPFPFHLRAQGAPPSVSDDGQGKEILNKSQKY